MTEPGRIDYFYSDNCHLIGRTGRRFESAPGVSTIQNLRYIRDLMRQYAPSNTLEIGMALGASCVTFASMHVELGHLPDGDLANHVAIDPFQGTVWDDAGRLILANTGLDQFVEVVELPSCIALPRLLSEGRKFGIIYIDGSHLFEDVFLDAYFGMRLLNDGGYLLFDDCADRHVKKVLSFLQLSVPGLRRQPANLACASILAV